MGRATCTRHKCTDDAFELGGVAEVRQRDYGKRAIGAEAVDQADSAVALCAVIIDDQFVGDRFGRLERQAAANALAIDIACGAAIGKVSLETVSLLEKAGDRKST